MIFWFSGTGNSRHVAGRIARYTNDRTQSIADAVQNERYAYSLVGKEPLGIVCPTYYVGIPAMVDAFLEKLTIESAGRPYTYVIFTCGGSPCNAVSLIRKHLPVDYTDFVAMPDNFVIKYDMRDPADIRMCLDNAERSLNKIYGVINRREIPKKRSDGLLNLLMTRALYPNYDKTRQTASFHADDACTGCGFCAEVCPDKAIELRGGKPVWNAPLCDLCLACVHRCPAKALQFGSKTAKHRRYVHPDLTLQSDEKK